MKKIIFLNFAFLMLISSFICTAQTGKKNKVVAKSIEAYYFHNTQRCMTCKAVESEAKADLESLYGKNVTFKALNLEDDATKPIAKKLNISGQTLLVIKGNKQVNLTNEGFLYAVSNPAKFKKIIKEKVDAL